MKKCLINIMLFLCVIFELPAQSVGLVLSGGGAKGIAHIGIIKALEENGIPIDFIAGTSIGAIIGSLYATGYSPDEMIKLIKSDNFIAWQTGKVDKKDLYYFKKNDPTPEFGRFNIDLGDTTKVKNGYFPMSLINPIQINLGMLELYAQASAAVNYDFDKLIVPFRCVASDIYNKQPIIFRKGDLSTAVRASMSLPFVFKAIEINKMPVYDGGIYNNFPVDVMLNDFNPDYTIGSVVVQLQDAVKKNLFGQIENMVMQKTDYSIDKNRGIVIQSIMSDIGLLEFDKVDKIYEIGYKTGLKYVEQIRERVQRRVKPENIELKRMAFKCHKPDLVFKNIEINGVLKPQKEYILSQIKRNENGLISFDAFKKTYYRLLSDRKIAEILPEAVYNDENQSFDLILNVKINENVTLGIGGFISSATPNQAYLGLQYQTLRFYSFDFNASAQLGNSYNAILLSGRIEIPSVLPLYLKISAASSTKKFFESKRLFSDENISAYLRQSETFARASLGTPFKTMGKAVASFTTGKLTDEYSQNITTGATMNLDESAYYLSGLSLRIEKNTLNSVVYPSSGINACFLMQGFSGKESYYKNETSYSLSTTHDNHTWGQAELKIHQYTPLLNHISLGTQLNVVASSKPLFNNYVATLVQSPAFAPTPHSKLVFNESLRALNYAAAGLIPVWENSKGFQIRGEVYGFVPYQHLTADVENKAVLGRSFGKPAYMGELSFVYNFPIVSVSLYGNHYSYPKNNWNWGINIGFLLYNPKFIE